MTLGIKDKNFKQELELILLKKLYDYKIIIFLQFKPNDNEDDKFYGKAITFDRVIKNKINRTDSLVRQGETEYTNGNVQVIIPVQETKFQ